MWNGIWNVLVGEAVRTSLPDRLRKDIEDQEKKSETLIGWVQLIVVCAFAILYGLSPKTFSQDAPFAPVPWALALYLAFTVIRLILSYRGTLPRWLLALSVIMDMGLLFGLVWSFHLQYMQPAAFYLKAPTLLYIFIFIALRSLRFEAGYVLLAGVTAAIGCLFLVLYAIASGPHGETITRDYVLYMTSSRVLLGGEVDKVITIIFVTLILALAILRAQRLVVRAAVASAAARDLSRFFAPEIAQQITLSENRIEPGHGELRTAAILFCDIRGFTKIAMKLPADVVMKLIAEYEARLVPIIHRHRGSIDKFMGDGILATFGAAVPSQSYAADALQATLVLAKEVRDWKDEREATGQPALDVGFSVAAGLVVFGAVGDATRLEYTVIGDPVNLVAKLQWSLKAERVRAITTTDTLATARTQGFQPEADLEVLPSRQVSGVEDLFDLVVLVQGE